MQIRHFRPSDAFTLRAVLQLARQHYATAQLQAYAPVEYDAAQWAERCVPTAHGWPRWTAALH